MTKIFSLVIVFAMLISTAGANTTSGLKAAFDELSYSLNVEWDQKDQEFYKKQMDKFNESILALRAQGMTNAEMMDFVKTQVKDANVARDIETAMTVAVVNKMSPEQASNYMLETIKKSYNQGSSWIGGSYYFWQAVAVVVVLAVIFGGGSSSDSSGEGAPVPGGQCFPQYRCDNVCTYDYKLGYFCTNVCYWTQCLY